MFQFEESAGICKSAQSFLGINFYISYLIVHESWFLEYRNQIAEWISILYAYPIEAGNVA